MLSILDRYLLREVSRAMVATAAILGIIAAGISFTIVLQHVIKGSYPPTVIFQIFGLRMVDVLSFLLPLSLFLGILLGLGRMYRESEMHILLSSGMGAVGLLRPTGGLTACMVLLTGMISLWLGPLADRTSNSLIVKANSSVFAAGLNIDKFTELPGAGGGVIYTDAISHNGSELGHIFIAYEHQTPQGMHLLRINSSQSGHLYENSNGNKHFLTLNNGWQYEIPLGADNWRSMQYRQNDAALASPRNNTSNDGGVESLPTTSLMGRKSPEARAELAWRISMPVMCITLFMLGLPLARQYPRQPRFGRLLLAVLCFYFYYTLLAICRSEMIKDHWHNANSLWLVNLMIFLMGAWMFWRQYNRRKLFKGGIG